MNPLLKTYNQNPLQCNQYLVTLDNTGLMIDATSPVTKEMLADVENLESLTIIYTHYHFDHIAFGKVQQETFSKLGIKVTSLASLIEQNYYGNTGTTALHNAIMAFGRQDFYKNLVPPTVTRFIQHEEELGFADFKLGFVPGHSKGGLIIYSENHKILFTGDTLFTGGAFGRVDFEGGSYRELRQSLIKLFAMDDNYTLYPGHGPSGLLRYEKKTIKTL